MKVKAVHQSPTDQTRFVIQNWCKVKVQRFSALNPRKQLNPTLPLVSRNQWTGQLGHYQCLSPPTKPQQHLLVGSRSYEAKNQESLLSVTRVGNMSGVVAEHPTSPCAVKEVSDFRNLNVQSEMKVPQQVLRPVGGLLPCSRTHRHSALPP